MKLNPECLKDLLIFIEENSTPYNPAIIESDCVPEALAKYDMAEIEYHLGQARMSGLLDNYKKNIIGDLKISGLTPNGHQLLEQLKTPKIWKEVLKKCVSSIPTLISCVSEIVGLAEVFAK